MPVYKHHEYCPRCGAEYAYITLDVERDRCRFCGGRLSRLQLPPSVRKRREKEMPLSGGTEQRHKDLTQDQYNEIRRILQAWGYDEWGDIANVIAAIKYSLGVI